MGAWFSRWALGGGCLARLVNWVTLAVCVGCVTDTDPLKKKRQPEEAGVSPMFSFGNDAGGTPTGSFGEPSTPEEPPRTTLPSEPEGDRSLTLLHGVTDARHVYFCLVAGEGNEAELYPKPLPEDGLEFGEAFVLSEESAFDIGERALNVYLVASRTPLSSADGCTDLLTRHGFDAPPLMALPSPFPFPFPFADRRLLRLSSDPGTDGGVSESMDAGPSANPNDGGVDDSGVQDAGLGSPEPDAAVNPPELRVVSLVQAPAETFEKAFSTLLVPSGCIGSPAFFDPGENSLCGPGYDALGTTLTPVFVQLSRVLEFGTVGFQVLNANPAFPRATARSNPDPNEGTLLTIASAVSFGEIAPARARTGVPAEQLGMPVAESYLEILPEFGRDVLLAEPWGQLLERAQIEELENGRGYTLVLIGPVPDTPAANWWNGTSIALVKNAPLAD